MEERSFYSCPNPAYKNQPHPMQTEKDIFITGLRLMHKFYLIGVNEAAWGGLIDEIQRELIDQYNTAAKPLKRLAEGMAALVGEYLETRAYDPTIPSRSILMKKQEEETKAKLQNLKPAG